MKNTAGAPEPGKGTVLYYSARSKEPEHEKHIHCALSQKLATLMTMNYGGEHTPSGSHEAPIYFVPSSTIVGINQAHSLGIYNESDLFGGVVAHAFVCTKAISHGLIHSDAQAPVGWVPEFSRHVATSVLAGYTAFNLDDARLAGLRLLKQGHIRIKPVHASAGRGQVLVSTATELDAALDQQDANEISHSGIVLEEHLEQAITYSVGQVRVAGMLASYVGTQRLTTDNHGHMVYGGSDLIVMRGDFSDLITLNLNQAFHRSISQARIYDDAATRYFPDFFASRRNYDTISGISSQGQYKTGVLEQSWRIGGASAAEIAALQQFQLHPDLKTVCASTFEVFGQQDAKLPPNAQACFHGIDPGMGLMRKFVMTKAYDNQ